jgi:hypothetical protein
MAASQQEALLAMAALENIHVCQELDFRPLLSGCPAKAAADTFTVAAS